MASWNGYMRAIAEGEITSWKDYFWHFIGMNRRDVGQNEPLTLWKWNEETEFQKVTDAEEELHVAEAKTLEEYAKEGMASRKETSANYDKWNAASKVEIDKVAAIRDELATAMSKGLPEVMVEFHENQERYFKEALEHSFNRPHSVEGDFDAVESLYSYIRYCKRRVEAAKEKYNNRKERCRSNREFLATAQEMYGQAPMGIVIKDSSEMW